MTDQELTRWAAEKVMGWKEVLDTSSQQYFWEDTFGNWHFPVHGYDRFNPLHDLNHAFMVVERMIEKGFLLKLGYGLTVQGLLAWVKFTKEPESIYHHNKSIGRAICLAALEAVRTQSVATKSPQ